ncbi:hypothetical protein ACIBG7_18625 [Nonomuraea sp. NPDC050328]|uniref:hypothetical protein n=1 Tax=Nonomuraea sp. NPDC050328 TaxID=3364361 RepID=UPI0037BB01CB
MTTTGYFVGQGGGAPWPMDLPLPEVMQQQVTKGYLRRVNPDGSPYTEADGSESSASRLTKSSSKAEWVGWAVANGMLPDDAEAMTKQDLIDLHDRMTAAEDEGEE